MKRTHGLDEREMELVKLLMADCQTTGDIQAKLKKLFAGTIKQMLEAEMDEHLLYRPGKQPFQLCLNVSGGLTVCHQQLHKFHLSLV